VGGRVIWQHLTFTAHAGEFIAVLGPNGAGKSTLLKAILGLQPLSAGSLQVLGVPARRGNAAIGYVPQRRRFDPDMRVRGRDFVQLGIDGTRWGVPLPLLSRLWRPERRQAEAQRLAWAVELAGAQTLIDRPIGELSGGEQQRILLAQALVAQPRLLLLDEPFEGLDLASQRAVSALIQHVSQEAGAAVLLVTHDVNPILPYADQVMYLAGGSMAIGPPGQVITSETLSALYNTSIEVLHTQDGRIVVVGQPEEVSHHASHADHLDGG
jgi:zinc/manganese transport system ATP-binding protein